MLMGRVLLHSGLMILSREGIELSGHVSSTVNVIT